MDLKILKNWRTITHSLNQLSEDEVFDLLDYERKHDCRLSILERLHQRYSSLRVARERMEIAADATKI